MGDLAAKIAVLEQQMVYLCYFRDGMGQQSCRIPGSSKGADGGFQHGARPESGKDYAEEKVSETQTAKDKGNADGDLAGTAATAKVAKALEIGERTGGRWRPRKSAVGAYNTGDAAEGDLAGIDKDMEKLKDFEKNFRGSDGDHPENGGCDSKGSCTGPQSMLE